MLDLSIPMLAPPTMEAWIGIDPGLSGALAVLTSDEQVYLTDLPTIEMESLRTRHNKADPTAKPKRVKGIKRALDEDEVCQILECLTTRVIVRMVAIEKVGPMPKEGAIASFNFGYTTGALNGILAAFQFSRVTPTPQAWKKDLGVAADKEAARMTAIARWPQASDALKLKKHDGRAEALWLALYARRASR